MKISAHLSADPAKTSARQFLPAFTTSLLSVVLFANTVRAASYYFDVNGVAAGSGVANNGSYAVGTTWNPVADGTGTPVGVQGTAFRGSTLVFSAGTDAAGLNYTVTSFNSYQPSGVTVTAGYVTLANGSGYSSPTISTMSGTSLNLGAWDYYGNVNTINPASSSTVAENSLANQSNRGCKITKTGNGLMVVSNAASARGITIIVNNGEFRIQNGNALFTSGYAASVAVTNTGSLEVVSNITVVNNPITISGNGYNNSGALLNYANSNNYNSLITLSGASRINANPGTILTLDPASGNAVTGAGTYGLTLGGGGTIRVGAPLDSITSLTLDGGTTVVCSNANGSASGSPFDAATAISVGAGSVLDLSAFGGLSLLNNQTLGGSGTLNGSVSTSSGCQLLPGGSLTTGTLTITTNLTLAGGETFQFDFPSSTTNDLVVVGGNLTPSASAPTTISLTTLPLSGLTPGNYVLFQVNGNLNGNATNFTVSAASAQTFSVIYNAASSPAQVLLHVTGNVGPQSLVWQGGQNGNAWDITGTTSNWLNGVNTAAFFNGDTVSFTDAGSVNQPVMINGFVTPASVTITVNSPNAYTFAGAGGIIGPGGLTLNGTGSLTLAEANAYTNNTLVAGGTLIFTDGGSVAGNITNNSAMVFNLTGTATMTNPIFGSGSLADTGGGNITLTGPISLGGIFSDSASGNLTLGGSLSVNAPVTNSGIATLALGSVTINGGGGLVNSAGGTILLAGASVYTGGVVNSSGTLQIGNGTTGTPGSGPIMNAGSLIFNSGQNFAITDVISGGGALTQNGANTVTLVGANTYDGVTTINSGFLVASNANALGSTVGGTTIGGGTSTGVLGVSGGITLAAEAITLSGRQGAATYSPHIVNLAGTNVIPGSITGSTGGGNYNVQSASGLLIMAGDFSLSATTATRPLDLQGAGNGLWSGSIANGGTTLALAKYDAGTWSLSGTNTYTGSTTISGGTLILGSTGSISNSPSISLAAGTVFDVSAQNFTLLGSQTLSGSGVVNGNVTTSAGSQILPGGSGMVGTLTLNNNLNLNGGETFDFDLPNIGSNDLIAVQGDLTPSGSAQTVINLATLPVGGYLTNGNYVLFQVSGNLNGSPTDFAVTPAARQSYTVVYDTVSSPKRVLLQVSGSPASLVWQGGQNGNVWDINATSNWLNGVAIDIFFNGDKVLFTDAGAVNPPALATTVIPDSVTFSNNSPNDYTLSGIGAIAGPGWLTKSGSAMLTIYNTNKYTGGTVINGGTLSLAVVNALGSAGTIDFTNNSTLQWNGITTDLSARLKIEDGVTATIDTMGGTVAFGSTVQLGSLKTGGLTKLGSGQLTIGGNQNFLGPLTISEGIVAMASSRTLATNLDSALATGAYLYLNGSSLYFDQVSGSGRIGLTYTTAGTDTLTVGGANGSSEFDGVITDGSARRIAVTKTGSGTFTLTGDNTYSGATVVSNGTLVVNGTLEVSSLGSSAVTVFTNATLAGAGSVSGPVTIRAGGTLAPGTNGIGTLTINNNFTNAGNLWIKVNKSLSPAQSNDLVSVSGVLTNSGTGTLTVTNIGALALAPGDIFPVFNAALANGNALAIAGPAGVSFTNNLAVDGTISVLSVLTIASNPTNITVSVNGGNTLNLSWPADHLGWMVQSNSLNLAVPADWYDLSNTVAGTNYSVTINAAQPNVFYRLRHP